MPLAGAYPIKNYRRCQAWCV